MNFKMFSFFLKKKTIKSQHFQNIRNEKRKMFSIHLPYRFPETDEYTFTLNHFLYYYFRNVFKYISFTPQQVNTLQKWTYDFLFLKRTLGLRIISGLYACYEKYSKITEPI